MLGRNLPSSRTAYLLLCEVVTFPIAAADGWLWIRVMTFSSLGVLGVSDK